jgi:hypothetical protein
MDNRCTGNRLTVNGGLTMFGFGGGLYNDIESNWQQDIIASNRRMQVIAYNKLSHESSRPIMNIPARSVSLILQLLLGPA